MRNANTQIHKFLSLEMHAHVRTDTHTLRKSLFFSFTLLLFVIHLVCVAFRWFFDFIFLIFIYSMVGNSPLPPFNRYYCATAVGFILSPFRCKCSSKKNDGNGNVHKNVVNVLISISRLDTQNSPPTLSQSQRVREHRTRKKVIFTVKIDYYLLYTEIVSIWKTGQSE